MRVSLAGVRRRYGEREVLKGVDWQIHDGERWALVGPNGSGKTTLLKILAGREDHDEGEVARARDLRIATVPQDDLAAVTLSARQYLLKAFSDVLSRERELQALHDRMAEGDASQETLDAAAHLQEWLHHHGGYTYETDLERTLLGLGFSLEDADRPCRSFSGGEQMRLKLGRALLDPANLLLLDEPGNHLDDRQRAWLGDFLQTSPRAFVVVSHDPEILEGAVDHVALLSDGRLYTFRGDFASFEVQFEEMQKTRERAYEQQQAFIERTQEFIRRYKAGQRSKQARGRQKVLSRLERVEAPLRGPQGFRLDLRFEEIPGEDVLAVENLALDVGGRTVRAPKLLLKRGQKVALVGPNGSGKTTLIRALVGDGGVSAGSIRWGTNVRLAHYDQHQQRLPLGSTLFEAVGGLLQTLNRELILTYLGAFGFGGSRAEQGVGSLSGGEKARLHLLAVLLAKANVLFLDEPTNHLDQTAKEILRDALLRYKGTLVLVSHEEDFLTSITGHTWAVGPQTIRSAAGYAPELAEPEEAQEQAGSPAKAPTKPAERKSAGLSKNERFRLERRLKETESRMAALHAERAEMEKRFMDPDAVFAEDWHALNRRFEALKSEIASAEEEWLDVTTKLEQG
ncbi:MAG: ABC-F family ATP-binding cassette domain-containing protein [Acidobacteriota bacterium]